MQKNFGQDTFIGSVLGANIKINVTSTFYKGVNGLRAQCQLNGPREWCNELFGFYEVL
jgi:hypothetical protein